LDIRIDREALLRDARRLAPAAAVACLCLLPLLVAGFRLWLRGDYVSQRYLWRSAPPGIDIGTFVLGNPHGALWGSVPLDAYARFGIDGIEQTAWIAPAALFLCAAALRLRSRDREVRRWLAIGGAFLLWALGPYAVAFGHQLPFLLPATLVRFVPIVANARIPSRTIVMVYLAAAMLAAIGFAALRDAGRKVWALALAGLALADSAPAWPPILVVDRPAIYDVLRQRPEEGAVCELPLGLRDGFGEIGRFDSRVLLYQTIHEHPITGGFVARMPPRIPAAYEADAVLGPLLRLSSGEALSDVAVLSPDRAAEVLRHDNIHYFVVNRNAAPADLLVFVRSLPLRLLASAEGRDLYVVDR